MSAYGDNGPLRDWLEKNKVAYVVAVACDTRVPGGAGQTIRADALAAEAPARGWQRISCGPGSKGERLYDWAVADAGGGRRQLIRRSLSSGELAYYLCWSPGPAGLAGLVRVAGARWRNAFRRPRTRPRSTIIRYASTTPGSGT